METFRNDERAAYVQNRLEILLGRRRRGAGVTLQSTDLAPRRLGGRTATVPPTDRAARRAFAGSPFQAKIGDI